MRENDHQQEIILVATSSLGRRHLAEKDHCDASPNESNIERIERACWNGLIADSVPEVLGNSSGRQKLFLWNVRPLKHTLLIEMSTDLPTTQKEFSINPDLVTLRGILN